MESVTSHYVLTIHSSYVSCLIICIVSYKTAILRFKLPYSLTAVIAFCTIARYSVATLFNISRHNLFRTAYRFCYKLLFRFTIYDEFSGTSPVCFTTNCY